jgi:hypothetical protein
MPIQTISDMDTFMGSAPAIDAYNRIPEIADTYNIITKAANYTCQVQESGSVYTATAAATFTLPAVTNTGWHAWFVNKADTNMVVASAAGDDIVADGDAAADSITFSTASHKIGGWCHVVSDGTNWLILGAGLLLAVPTIAT